MLSHGNKPKSDLPISKSIDDLTQTQIHDENIIVILRPKVICRECKGHIARCPIHSCAKYGLCQITKTVARTQSHKKLCQITKTVARTQSHKNHMNFILR